MTSAYMTPPADSSKISTGSMPISSSTDTTAMSQTALDQGMTSSSTVTTTTETDDTSTTTKSKHHRHMHKN
jgi:hypothetical protein